MPYKDKESEYLWRRNHPEEVRIHRRRHKLKKYGLTLDDYDSMFDSQGGVCAICFEIEKEDRGQLDPLSVDHNHDTGKVRGLLCGRCNRAIGLMNDNPKLLRQAVIYLEEKQ